VAVARRLPETSPKAAAGGLRDVAVGYVRILRDLRFLGFALAGGFAGAGMFAYIAASPFVFIEQLGLTPNQFAIVFGANAFALIAFSQFNHVWLRHAVPPQILGRGLFLTAGASLLICALAWTRTATWPLLSAGLFLYVGSIGTVGPNAVASAMAGYGRAAGSASALLGALQFSIAALAGLAVGSWHDHTSRPLGTVIVICGLAAWVSGTLATRDTRWTRAADEIS
jgi:DHA1 family bicyclomycin/chloramphenicol resistance-like MFS transporter